MPRITFPRAIKHKFIKELSKLSDDIILLIGDVNYKFTEEQLTKLQNLANSVPIHLDDVHDIFNSILKNFGDRFGYANKRDVNVTDGNYLKDMARIGLLRLVNTAGYDMYVRKYGHKYGWKKGAEEFDGGETVQSPVPRKTVNIERVERQFIIEHYHAAGADGDHPQNDL